MAALLPTILSDDECDEIISKRRKKHVVNAAAAAASAQSSSSSSSSGGSTKARDAGRGGVNDDDDDDDDDGMYDDEMDEDFEFGGLLGEDGTSLDANVGGGLGGAPSDVSWSYKSALALLTKNDSSSGVGAMVERTSVASIIAAARSNLRRGNVGTDVDDDGGEGEVGVVGEGGVSKIDGTREDNDDDDDDDDDEDGSGESHSSSSGGDSDDDDESSDDDVVDDADRATNSMESDVLKVQERRTNTTTARNKKRDGNQVSGRGDDDAEQSQGDGGSSSSSSSEASSEEDDDDEKGDGSGSGDHDSDDDDDERREAAKAAAFFDTSSDVVGSSGIGDDPGTRIDSFSMLGISRPLLRGVASMGFVSPTPIQSSVVPVALAGRDVCASAVTGSGKTAAFLLPIMERILQRGGGRTTLGGGPNNNARGGKSSSSPSSLAATRALILAPTRELAAQCVSMMTAMAKFTDLRAALIVGGAKNVMSQAAELRTRPDVVVATPGRLLDHIANSQGVDMDDVEFLILDEADRLLDLGFQDEVHEIVKSCPAERQTMLFSATMSTKVDELIRLSLKRPVRISATDKERSGRPASSNNGVEVAPRLEQEFVRVRAGNEGVNREGMLLALLTRTFRDRIIVFFDTKSAAHRLMIVCGLCGIKCAELHGNLTQVQRLEALEAFREGSVDVLLCTDLAARGLDISGVEAVINFEMPSQVETYVHRIGRTARAGRGGKSCTLIGEGRRYLMKEVIKDADEKNRKQKHDRSSHPMGIIRSRTIPSSVIAHFVAKINSLEKTINEVMDAETVARLDRIAEMEAVRVKNIIEHSDSIKSRPQREWFATPKEKLSVKAATAERKKLMEAKVGTGTHRMTRKKRRAQEAREMFLEAKEEATEREEETGKKSKKVFTEAQIKGSARASKRKEAQRENELAARSLNDDDKRKDRKLKQKRKAANLDAAGDGGLFTEEIVAHVKKPKRGTIDAPAKSSYTFHEHDPNKKKGKKKAHHAFKSQSKFKRR